MRMSVGYRTFSVALALVLLLAAMPVMPSPAASMDETTEDAAADDAETASDAVEDDIPLPPHVALLDPTWCQSVEPDARPSASPVAPASPVASASSVAEVDPDLWDYGGGVQANDAAKIWTVGATQLFLSCSNAGNAPAALALVTDAYRRAHGEAAETSTPVVRAMPVDALLGLITIPDVREHESGQVVVFFELEDPGYCDWYVTIAFVFEKVGDTWLIEAIADVTDEDEPVAYQPPVFRPSDAPQCGSST